MKNRKNILLVCAAGYATTSMMKMGIEDELSKRGVDISQLNIQIATISNILNYIDKADLIVTALSIEESEYDVPIINGIPLLTGIEKNDVIDKIIEGINLESS